MNKELYVSSTPHETRVALTEDDQLAEVFFERENEYTLAGSIYKGRVTRVLPGMQSAFVDIGLERDAFLYVSDFLEMGEEGEEEFDQIPAGRGTVDLRPQEQRAAGPATTQVEEQDEEIEAVGEGFTPPNGNSQPEAEGETNAAAGNGDESEEGARPWRGRRRRRGGRRGHEEERSERPARTEAAPEERAATAPPEPAHRQSGPPAGYTPMMLPGESISKYRGRARQPEEQSVTAHAASPVQTPAQTEDSGDEASTRAHSGRAHYDEEPTQPSSSSEPEASDFEHGHAATEPEQLEWAAAGAHHPAEEAKTHPSARSVAAEPETSATTAEKNPDFDHDDSETVFEVAERMDDDDYEVEESSQHAEEPAAGSHRYYAADAVEPVDPSDESDSSHTDFATGQSVAQTQTDEPATHEHASPFPGYASAPATAPQGRTLEHETLEDEEMEFHPVPEDLEALS